MKKLSEFDLIETYFAPLAGEGSFALKDDAAQIIPTQGNALVITQDAIAEGIHFFPDDAPALIAKKALRVNLSDLAAKGAMPKSFSLGLGLGHRCDGEWIKEFASGLKEDCDDFNISLSGGDTFKTDGGAVISITAIGEVPNGKYVSRLCASEGDAIFVTGTIGDGALGLMARQGQIDSEFLSGRYMLPQPRVEFSKTVQDFASSAMDISDGLIGDLEKLCKASNVGAQVYVEKIPFSAAASDIIKVESIYLETALTGGDDYEILLSVPLDKSNDFIEKCKTYKFAVTQIGKITPKQGVTVLDETGKTMTFKKTGYDHSGE